MLSEKLHSFPKGYSGNRFAALYVSKNLSELERLRLLAAKLEIENERLKKGYWVERVGVSKECITVQDLTKLLAEQHKKHPAHGYMLAKAVIEKTGWGFSLHLAHKCCNQPGIRSKARKYIYKKAGEEHVAFLNKVKGNWNTVRPIEIVVSDMTMFKNNGECVMEAPCRYIQQRDPCPQATPIQGNIRPYHHCLEQLKLLSGEKDLPGILTHRSVFRLLLANLPTGV